MNRISSIKSIKNKTGCLALVLLMHLAILLVDRDCEIIAMMKRIIMPTSSVLTPQAKKVMVMAMRMEM